MDAAAVLESPRNIAFSTHKSSKKWQPSSQSFKPSSTRSIAIFLFFWQKLSNSYLSQKALLKAKRHNLIIKCMESLSEHDMGWIWTVNWHPYLDYSCLYLQVSCFAWNALNRRNLLFHPFQIESRVWFYEVRLNFLLVLIILSFCLLKSKWEE